MCVYLHLIKGYMQDIFVWLGIKIRVMLSVLYACYVRTNTQDIFVPKGHIYVKRCSHCFIVDSCRLLTWCGTYVARGRSSSWSGLSIIFSRDTHSSATWLPLALLIRGSLLLFLRGAPPAL